MIDKIYITYLIIGIFSAYFVGIYGDYANNDNAQATSGALILSIAIATVIYGLIKVWL